MVVALIVIGVIVFLVFDAWLLGKVFSSHKSADDHGSFPVPGSLDVTLPAGKVKLNYHESKRSGGDEDTIYFGIPDTRHAGWGR